MGKNESIQLSRKYETVKMKGENIDEDIYAWYKTPKPCMNKYESMSEHKEMWNAFMAENTMKASNWESIGIILYKSDSKKSRIQSAEGKKIK